MTGLSPRYTGSCGLLPRGPLEADDGGYSERMRRDALLRFRPPCRLCAKSYVSPDGVWVVCADDGTVEFAENDEGAPLCGWDGFEGDSFTEECADPEWEHAERMYDMEREEEICG